MSVSVNKVDLHIHSRHSDAPASTVRKITQVCLSRGIGCCICDHNEIRGSIKLLEENRITTAPSIEIGSRTNVEFLVYFPRPESLETYFRYSVEPFKLRKFYSRLARDFEPLVREAKELGAAVTLPHPFAPGWKNLGARRHAADLRRILAPEFLKLIDFVEVINGHISDKRNFRAYQFAEKNRKRFVVGSDAHNPADIGKVYVEFKREVTSAELLPTLKKHNRMLTSLPYSPWTFVSAARRVAPHHLMLFFLPTKQRVWMDQRTKAHGRR